MPARKSNETVEKTIKRGRGRPRKSVETYPLEEPIFVPPTPVVTRSRNYAPLLVTALLMVTFMLGMAFMKIQTLEKAQATAQANAANADANPAPSGPPAKVKVDKGTLPILGNKDAKVTIVEFADFRCPFCERLYNDVFTNLKKDYIDTGKVQFYFRHYAFLGQQSTWAAEAAECANEQDKFWAYHNYLYEHQADESNLDAYAKSKLIDIASSLGLNTDQFSQCLNDDKYSKKVADDLADGQKYGVTGTPTLYVNGTPVVGAQPYTAFKTLIDEELKK